MDFHSLAETARTYDKDRDGPFAKWFYQCHGDTDRFIQAPPPKVWKQISHRKARMREQEQLNKIKKNPNADFNTDLVNPAHGLDLWDWY